MEKKVTIYEADDRGLSIVDAVSRAGADLRASAPLIWRLFVRDYVAQFRQRLLGYLWIVISPIVSIAGYWFMAATGFLRPGAIGIPYVLFLYVGTSIWGLFIATMTAINGSVLANGDLLMRTSAPPIALALAGLANLIYSIGVNVVVLLLLLLVARFPPSWFIVVYPLLLLPVLVMGTGIGLVLASIGVIARDITTMAISAFGVLMFLTPVIYDARFESPMLSWIVFLNPLSYLVSFPRELALVGTADYAWGYVAASSVAVICLILGLYCFYLIKDRMIERL